MKSNAPIDKYFDEYTKELAKKLWLELNWEENEVQDIDCDYCYKDGIKKI